jgi:hypothetical protein
LQLGALERLPLSEQDKQSPVVLLQLAHLALHAINYINNYNYIMIKILK